MRRYSHALLMFAATLAVAWAQTFGIQRGWLCECGGTARLTMADHCHGPRSSACHEEDQDHPHDHDGDEDTRQHTAVMEDLLWKNQETSAVQAPALTVVALSAWDAAFPALTHPGEGREDPPDERWNHARPPWPFILAHSVILRI